MLIWGSLPCSRVKDWWKSRSSAKEFSEATGGKTRGKTESQLESEGLMTRWQEDLDMVPYDEEMGLFFEYLEMGEGLLTRR